MQLEIAYRTHTGLVRTMNQDAILVMPETGIFLVADGMGGEQAGEEASEQVVKTVRAAAESFFTQAPTGPSQVEGMLRDALVEANHDVYQISVDAPEKRGLGSTGSLLCLHRGVYFVTHVGDSRVYLVHEGQVRLLTHDQTLVWLLYEQGAITRDQLETHPERHLLTQCIGSARPINVESLEGGVEPGDLFLICSDGLTGYAGEEAVERILLSDRPLEEMADALVDEALKAGGGDNVSVILVRATTLDETDTWRPEATAPPPDFSARLSDREFVTGELPPPPRRRRRRGPLVAAGALVLLGIVALAILLALRPRGALVTLSGLPDGEVQAFAIQSNPGGLTQVSPGVYRALSPAHYGLHLYIEGYAPVFAEWDVSDGEKAITVNTGPWIREARLSLSLPPSPAVSRLRVVREAAGRPPRNVCDLDGATLAGKRTSLPGERWTGEELSVAIEPEVKHTIIAEAAGRPPFTARVQLRPGDTRAIKIFFNNE